MAHQGQGLQLEHAYTEGDGPSLFEIKETTISHSDGHTTINKTPKMTGKGQTYFAKLFLAKPTQEAGA